MNKLLFVLLAPALATLSGRAEADAWAIETANASGTRIPRLVCTGGVGTSRLKVRDANLELQPQNPLPATSAAGAIAFDSVAAKFKVFDGSTWKEPGTPHLREFAHLLSPTADFTAYYMPPTIIDLAWSAYLRKKVDLTHFTQFRIVATQTVAGASTAKLRIQYTTDQVLGTWNNLEDTTTNADLDAASVGTAKSGAYGTIVSAARADVFIRVAGHSGDGLAAPAWRMIVTQFK